MLYQLSYSREPVAFSAADAAGKTASTAEHAPHAGVAQLAEHQLPKLRVAGSRPVSRSTIQAS